MIIGSMKFGRLWHILYPALLSREGLQLDVSRLGIGRGSGVDLSE